MVDGGAVSNIFGELDYGLSVNARSTSTAAATTFALWLTTTAAGTQSIADAIDLIPARTGTEPDWDGIGLSYPERQIPALQGLYSTAIESDETRDQFGKAIVLDSLKSAVVSVLEGGTTPEDAISRLVRTVELV
jgi:hypothetical protein